MAATDVIQYATKKTVVTTNSNKFVHIRLDLKDQY